VDKKKRNWEIRENNIYIIRIKGGIKKVPDKNPRDETALAASIFKKKKEKKDE